MLEERLRIARKRKKLTQQYVAEQLDVTAQAYSTYETGAVTPNPKTLKTLAILYGVSSDYLLGLTDDPTPTSQLINPAKAENVRAGGLVANGGDYGDLTKEERNLLNAFTEYIRTLRLREDKGE